MITTKLWKLALQRNLVIIVLNMMQILLSNAVIITPRGQRLLRGEKYLQFYLFLMTRQTRPIPGRAKYGALVRAPEFSSHPRIVLCEMFLPRHQVGLMIV